MNEIVKGEREDHKMAYPYYFNMEVMALEIASASIDAMTDFDWKKDVFNDQEMYNNLRNGFIALTNLSCYIESFLNTILNRCIGYEGKLLRDGIENKLDAICLHYSVDEKSVKSYDTYKTIIEVNTVRNSMIHHKKPFMGEGTLPVVNFGNKGMEFFKQSNFRKIYKDYNDFCITFSNLLGLKIYDKIYFIAAEARDQLVNYVYDPKKTDVDESRFN